MPSSPPEQKLTQPPPLESSAHNSFIPHELAALYQLVESTLNLDPDVMAVFQRFFTFAFTEKLAGRALLKPNAIPFALLSYQKAGILPNDPQQLKELLSSAVTGIVDATNIKRINEDSNIGGSYMVGDATLLLHLASLEHVAAKHNLTLLIFRPQGDEFLPLFIPQNGVTINIDDMTNEIEIQTQKLVGEIANDPSHPLYQLAKDHHDLLTKSMSFVTINNITLPQHVARSSDLGEIILAQAEKIAPQKETPFSPYKRLLNRLINKHLNSPVFPEIPISGDQSAIDHLVSSVQETLLTLKLEKADPTNLDERWRLLQRYCPPAFADSLEKILDSTKNDPAKQALILKVLEESFFNTQFKRNPPILNRWLALEHLRQRDVHGKPLFTQGGMLSTYFLKLINLSDGRLGGTMVIRTSASQATESAPPTDSPTSQLIIYKDGGSFYFACTDQAATLYRKNLAENLDHAIKAILTHIRQNPEDSPANIKQLIRLWAAVPCYTFLPIPEGDRSNQSIGQYLDALRQAHYLRETTLAQDIYAYSDQIYPHQNLATVINTLFIFERALSRTDNLGTIWTQ